MNTPLRFIFLFFALTIPLAWLFWIPMILISQGLWAPPLPIPTIVWSSLGALSPLIALSIVERVSRRQVQLGAIFQGVRLREWRSPWVITSALFTLALTAALAVLYCAAENARGMERVPVQVFKLDLFASLGWFILLIIPLHFLTAGITSPVFEEPGWRGFAFEQLSRRVPRDLASLIVGSYWFLWHQGMNLAFDIQPSLLSYLSMLLDSFAIDAFYTLSRRNLLAAMLAHQSMGTAYMFLSPTPTLWYLLLVRVLAVAALRYCVHRQGRPTQAAAGRSIGPTVPGPNR